MFVCWFICLFCVCFFFKWFKSCKSNKKNQRKIKTNKNSRHVKINISWTGCREQIFDMKASAAFDGFNWEGRFKHESSSTRHWVSSDDYRVHTRNANEATKRYRVRVQVRASLQQVVTCTEARRNPVATHPSRVLYPLRTTTAYLSNGYFTARKMALFSLIDYIDFFTAYLHFYAP